MWCYILTSGILGEGILELLLHEVYICLGNQIIYVPRYERVLVEIYYMVLPVGIVSFGTIENLVYLMILFVVVVVRYLRLWVMYYLSVYVIIWNARELWMYMRDWVLLSVLGYSPWVAITVRVNIYFCFFKLTYWIYAEFR